MNIGHYLRQTVINEVGIKGQEKIKRTKILIIGLGGLGSPNVLYLAAAGVGTIGIVEGDLVEVTNLQRQILYKYDDVNHGKTDVTKKAINKINPDVVVKEHNTYLTNENAMEIISEYDLIINGTDNFPTRYLINDACYLLKKPIIDATVIRFSGQITMYVPGNGCYRCLIPVPPPNASSFSCSEVGVIGPVVGHIGSLQAVEAIKFILNIGTALKGKLLIYDGLKLRHTIVNWSKDENCPLCGVNPTINELQDYQEFCGIPVENENLDITSEKLLNTNLKIYDVRQEEDYEQAHIKGSVNISVDNIFKLNDFENSVIICEFGTKSRYIVEKIRKQGIGEIYNLKGGFNEWIKKELPINSVKIH